MADQITKTGFSLSVLVARLKRWLAALPESKKYIELITALLSVPVLISVIYLNLNNLKRKETPPTKDTIVITQPQNITTSPLILPTNDQKNASDKNQTIPTPTIFAESATITTTPCRPGIGSITIAKPLENEIVTANPFCVTIAYNRGDYCAVVWSYRLDGGSWSEYDDKSFCLYNLTSGEKTLELRVKSIVNGEEILLKRNFTYRNPQPMIISPTITLNPTQTQ